MYIITQGRVDIAKLAPPGSPIVDIEAMIESKVALYMVPLLEKVQGAGKDIVASPPDTPVITQ